MTLHGDHASVFYQIPVDAKKTPLVFLHGYGQSARGQNNDWLNYEWDIAS